MYDDGHKTMNAIRIAITVFVLILISLIGAALVWTSGHQPPPLRTASQIVLSAAAAAGIFAIVRIWTARSH